jgi:RNA polymerase sigma factor (sigma-70 family)
VAAAIRGDADSVRMVWNAHRRWVAAVVLAHKPRDVDLEDLLQEVAVSFVRTIGELRDAGALKPWLRTIAINAARAAGRKARTRRREVELTPAAEVLPPPAAADPGAGRDEARRLMDLALRLPEGYREPLLLRCVRGMSYRQIGELLGLPETTIETRIARGRRMLRELAGGGSGDTDEGHRSAQPKAVKDAPPRPDRILSIGAALPGC